jgi:peroxin-19
MTDMLDEFSATKLDTNEEAPKASGPGRPSAAGADVPRDLLGIEGLTDDDFAKQLQAGMADLLGEVQNNVRTGHLDEALFLTFSSPRCNHSLRVCSKNLVGLPR